MMSIHVDRSSKPARVSVDKKRGLQPSGLEQEGNEGAMWVVIGQNYHRGNYWGPASIRAVDLEKHFAVYPRLIITGENLEILQLDESMRNHFWVDNDGVLFFNTLDYLIQRERCNYSFLKIAH